MQSLDTTEAPEGQLIRALLDLSNHVMKDGERLAAEGGLTAQQWIVLLQIAGDPYFPDALTEEPRGLLASEIAAARRVSRATISAVVSTLRSRGLVQQVEEAYDRRRRRLVPTEEGLRLLALVDPERRVANRRLFESLSTEERRELLRMLTRCVDAALEGPGGRS